VNQSKIQGGQRVADRDDGNTAKKEKKIQYDQVPYGTEQDYDWMIFPEKRHDWNLRKGLPVFTKQVK